MDTGGCLRRLEPALHLLPLNETGLLKHRSPPRKHHEIWDAAYVVAGRKLGMSLCVHLQHDRFPSHGRCHPSHLGSRHPARSAPCSPEVDKNRNRRLSHYFVEKIGVRGDGTCQRRNLRFTDTTSASVSEVSRRNAIALSATLTGTGEWHGNLRSYLSTDCMEDKKVIFPVPPPPPEVRLQHLPRHRNRKSVFFLEARKRQDHTS